MLILVHTILGLPKTSGVSTFCAEVAAEQARMGHRVIIVYGLDSGYPEAEGVERLKAESLENIGVRPDLVHVHAIWSKFSVRTLRWCRKNGVPYVVSPHGGLMPRVFSTSKAFKKFLAWHLILKPLLNRACAIHCTSESEKAACEKLGLKGSFVIAPLGVRLPEKVKGRGEGEGSGEGARRVAAERKIEEWLAGVDEETFDLALKNLVEAKSAAGEYRFKNPEERMLALDGARRFYREFSRKIVPLSDGRYVYFAPDARAKVRNESNAISWAEYAFHAVSNGGKKVSGKNYNERWYNPHKQPAFDLIEEVLGQERCFIRLSSVGHRYDAIVFAGGDAAGKDLQIVTRLDEAGNVDANLSEVTFTASSKEKKSPRLVPLAEAVRTVVHYQITAGSYPSNTHSIAELGTKCKGQRTVLFLGRLSEEKGLLNLLEAWCQLQKKEHTTVDLLSPLSAVASAKAEPTFSSPPRLILAGPDWRGYRGVLEAKIAAEHIEGVSFFGPADEAAKDRLYREADIFVLPSPMENFSMVVLEALSYGVPAIATKGTPWSELETERCGWWIDQGVAPLKSALAQCLGAPSPQLREMGTRGRALSERRYQWSAVAETLLQCYRRGTGV